MCFKKLSFFVLCLLALTGCAVSNPEPTPIPQQPKIEVKKQKPKSSPVVCKQETAQQLIKKTHSLGIIGAFEPVRLPPMKSPLLARIDTGAQGSSVDAQNIQEFEREGKDWVAFDVTNPQTKEVYRFEKPLHKQVTIKRQLEKERRMVVLMNIKIGKETLTVPFSLADRENFNYPVLIGRNILTGRAIVDTAKSETLY